MITVYVLTVFLTGTTIEFTETHHTLKLCREEGIRQIQDYQTGGVRAQYECEAKEVEAYDEGTETDQGSEESDPKPGSGEQEAANRPGQVQESFQRSVGLVVEIA